MNIPGKGVLKLIFEPQNGSSAETLEVFKFEVIYRLLYF